MGPPSAATPEARAAALLLIAVVLSGCSSSVEPTSTSGPNSDRKNVLLITLDTTRADRLGCYGHDRETSPHLDALAESGIRFDLAVAQASLTPVSHASIMTGLRPPNHGVRVMYAGSGYRLSEEIPTLASVLKQRGWRTGAFLSAFPVSEFFGLGHGFDSIDDGLSQPAEGVLVERSDGDWGFDIGDNQRRSDVTTDRAISWLRESAAPFYMWVHYWDPHDPRMLPPDEVLASFPPAPGENKRKATYDAEIFYVDQQIGRLVRELEERGLYEQTIITVVADHGQGLGNHGFWGHRLLYQEQIRVPWILRFPGGPRRRVVPDLVSTTDLYPTLLAELGIDLPAAVDGTDLHGLIDGQAAADRSVYAEALNRYDLTAAAMIKRRPRDDVLYCMMNRSWKLIYRPLDPDGSELYDLRADPDELINVYLTAQDQAQSLLRELESVDAFVIGSFGEGEDEEALQRLRALGYL